MSDLKEWRQIASHGTSGDQVWNVILDWQKSEDALRSQLESTKVQLEIAVEALRWYSDYSSGNSKKANDALTEIDKIRNMK
jgi:hypothetical protein